MRRRRLGGRYELQEQLGASSWHAIDTELERDVFVRVPAEELVIARLVHPTIVQVFDQGEEYGKPYVVYEYLSGGSLAQRLDKGLLGEAEAQRIAADITAALAYAHAQGVTHGALGPATILLDAEGGGKVAEFAGVATQEDDEHALTAVLEILGANAIADSDADATAVLQPAPAASRRRPIAFSALAALVLLVAGVGAALLATSGESTSDNATGSVSRPTSTGRPGSYASARGSSTGHDVGAEHGPDDGSVADDRAACDDLAADDGASDDCAADNDGAAGNDGTAACDDRAAGDDGTAASDDRAAAAGLSPDGTIG